VQRFSAKMLLDNKVRLLDAVVDPQLCLQGYAVWNNNGLIGIVTEVVQTRTGLIASYAPTDHILQVCNS